MCGITQYSRGWLQLSRRTCVIRRHVDYFWIFLEKFQNRKYSTFQKKNGFSHFTYLANSSTAGWLQNSGKTRYLNCFHRKLGWLICRIWRCIVLCLKKEENNWKKNEKGKKSDSSWFSKQSSKKAIPRISHFIGSSGDLKIWLTWSVSRIYFKQKIRLIRHVPIPTFFASRR